MTNNEGVTGVMGHTQPDMLKEFPKEIILKDGTGVSLRPIQEGDEDRLIKMFNLLSEDDRWFIDGDLMDRGVIRKWIKALDQHRLVSIGAVLEKRVIALASLIRGRKGSESHIGRIWMSVDPAFREKHLATWMLLELANLAISIDLEILVMQLVEDRDSALIGSVKRLEFFEQAVLKDHVKDREGNFHNLLIMVKHLKKSWANSGAAFPSG
jgi:hypothetical protein